MLRPIRTLVALLVVSFALLLGINLLQSRTRRRP